MEENKKTEEVTSTESTTVEEEAKLEEAKAPAQEKKEEPKKENTVLSFLITTLNGMAYGLFATLIIGTIIGTIGTLFLKGAATSGFCKFIGNILSGTSTKQYLDANGNVVKVTANYGIAYCLQYLTGAGIGAGVAIALKKKPLEVVVLSAVGEIAAFVSLSTKFVTANVIADPKFQIGDPLTIYLTVIATALAMKYVLRKKTPVDILIIPLFSIAVGTIAGLLVRFPAIYVTYSVQWVVNAGTNAVPFIMGIIVAVLMGMALTAPISSAAIGAMVFTVANANELSYAELLANPSTSGLALASGAAIVGCCCQMVGFAIQSRKDNSIGMVVSIAIGTSMLQFKNILKKPMVWLPTIIASAILGPISTCWIKLVCLGSSAGMGTSGLVGQIGTVSSMGANQWQTWVGIFGLEIILPAILVYGIDLLFRHFKLIKEGDLLV